MPPRQRDLRWIEHRLVEFAIRPLPDQRPQHLVTFVYSVETVLQYVYGYTRDDLVAQIGVVRIGPTLVAVDEPQPFLLEGQHLLGVRVLRCAGITGRLAAPGSQAVNQT